MYNKTIVRFGIRDIQNSRDLGKGYQPQPLASAVARALASHQFVPGSIYYVRNAFSKCCKGILYMALRTRRVTHTQHSVHYVHNAF